MANSLQSERGVVRGCCLHHRVNGAAPPVIGPHRHECIRPCPETPHLQHIYLATACVIIAHLVALTFVKPLLPVPERSYESCQHATVGVRYCRCRGQFISGQLIDSYQTFEPVVAGIHGAVRAGSWKPACGQLNIPCRCLALWLGRIGSDRVRGFPIVDLREADQEAMPASVIYVAIFNAAIGVGVLLGGIVLSMTSLNELILIAAATIPVVFDKTAAFVAPFTTTHCSEGATTWNYVIFAASWPLPKNSISPVRRSGCTLSNRP